MSDQWWIWLAIGYLAGSSPFGFLIGLAHGVDIRDRGSGNIGATNVGRLLGRKWGIVSLLLDVAKGFVPVCAAAVVLGYWGRWDLPDSQAWCWLAIATAPVDTPEHGSPGPHASDRLSSASRVAGPGADCSRME